MLERILRAKPYAMIILVVLCLSAWASGLVANPPLWALAVLIALLATNFGILVWRQVKPLSAISKRS